MSFIADKQSLEDLNILGRYKNNSIARLFDKTVTDGGSRIMEAMFTHPLRDADAINQRTSILRYFGTLNLRFPISGDSFARMENYLRSSTGGNLLSTGINIISKKTLQIVAQDKDYEVLLNDVLHSIEVLNQLDDFSRSLDNTGHPYREEQDRIRQIFEHPKLSWLKKERGAKKLSFFKLISYDFLLNGGLREQMSELTTLIFKLDVYLAVAMVAKERGFCYANALPGNAHKFFAEDLYHPVVENAIGNTVSLDKDNNVLFLTGANMAGKSTLMKALGISLYLAHMGFPVAARQMEFSIKDGIYTSINVADNLGMGYSHFYAEVLRVKKVAEEVAAGKNLFAIFDELFKGTNVKDAFDATLAITAAFSETRECFFVISTHITEVGDSLTKSSRNFSFAYLPTVMDGNRPRYTYRLKEGITSDRQGMMIIENEGILDLLK